MKNQKGITLVALIITIIVMLILAGVALAFSVGEEGIMTQAENAKKTQSNSEEEERVSLAVLSAKTSKLSSNEEIEFNETLIKEAIEKEFGTGSCTVKEETEYFVVIMLNSKNEYKISKLEKGNAPTQVSIEGKYGDDSISTGTSSDFEYYIFNNDGTGEYCEDHELPRSFEYVLQNHSDGSIVFENGETIQFMFEGTEKNKVIYIIDDDGTGRELIVAYTNNARNGMALKENVRYKWYDNDDYYCDIIFNGETWKVEATGENPETGEIETYSVVQSQPYFIKGNIVYFARSVNTNNKDKEVYYNNVFAGSATIVGDSIYSYSS